MGALWSRITELFSAFQGKELEICVVGLENAGKTTLLGILSTGHPQTDVPFPTIGLNVVTFAKAGGNKFKCWDLGGQQMYRSEWSRYASGCDVIIFVVDVSDIERLPTAKYELHQLLESNPLLGKTPLMICANKIDIDPHASEAELISALNLDYITEQPWIVFPVSAMRGTNMDKVMTWLINQ
ncbi:hypothetical protein BASA81_002442 [Batrachochytrium salamandrivorans]|nr:hypothetical protein BASA81_002442 [Batrachochytrium salamandrivorans]